MLYIRGDANAEIGSGHIMRCLAIAGALRKRGEDAAFITADRQGEQLITGNDFSMICLDTSWNNLEEEIEKLIALIREKRIEKLLVDSYFATEEYIKSLHRFTKIIIMDDLKEAVYSADLVINYNIYAIKLNYAEQYSSTARLLVGPAYIPLREEFGNVRRIQRKKPQNVLITTGGSDYCNMAGILTEYLEESRLFTQLKFHVIVGAFSPYKEELEKLKRKYDNVFLYQNVTRMSEIMNECDAAISAGGTTLYELCACGLPAICFTFADNQLLGAKEMQNQGILYYAGDIRENKRGCLDFIIDKLKLLIHDYNLRESLSARMVQLVDGQGADRIAQEIVLL